jgi:hypothetical protein
VSIDKDDFSNSQTKSQNNSSFPFEYVDKRRSSRVQSIQNKNTKDLDDAALLERITSLFNDLCSENSQNSTDKSRRSREQSQNNKSKQLIDNVKERECFNQFFKKLNQLNKPTVLSIFQTFLYFNSTELNLPLPTVYKDIYAIYRHHNPLPSSSILLLDCDKIQTHELWSILVANEIKFDIAEVTFLTELLVYLEANLDEQQFLTFLIKLFIIRGINQPNNLEYLEYAKTKLEQLKDPIYNINNEEITVQLIKALICSQSINNLQRLFEEQKYDELFELLTSELQLNDNDLKIVCKSIIDSKNYEKGK